MCKTDVCVIMNLNFCSAWLCCDFHISFLHPAGAKYNAIDIYYNSEAADPATKAMCSAVGLTSATTPATTALLSTAVLTTAAPSASVSSSTATPVTSTAPFVSDHPAVVVTMTGTIDTFSEGSDRRRSFISSFAALLIIFERQIVILSVRSGSIIVDLAFARDAASSVSPSDFISRLKDAAAAGKLVPLGITGLSIGGQFIAVSSASAEFSLVSSAFTEFLFVIIAGIVVVAIVNAAAFVKMKNLKTADSKGWIVASLLCGPLVWLFWSLCRRPNKVSPQLQKSQKAHFSTHFATAAVGYVGLADRLLDINDDDFDMRSPIDGLDEQPLLPFKTITEAGPFVMKFPSAAKFAQVAAKAGRQKLHNLGEQAHGLTADEIAIIYLCVRRLHILSNKASKTICEQLYHGKPVLSCSERIASQPQS